MTVAPPGYSGNDGNCTTPTIPITIEPFSQVTPPPASGGTCTPVGTTTVPPTGATQGEYCNGEKAFGGGCASGQVCALAPLGLPGVHPSRRTDRVPGQRLQRGSRRRHADGQPRVQRVQLHRRAERHVRHRNVDLLQQQQLHGVERPPPGRRDLRPDERADGPLRDVHFHRDGDGPRVHRADHAFPDRQRTAHCGRHDLLSVVSRAARERRGRGARSPRAAARAALTWPAPAIFTKRAPGMRAAIRSRASRHGGAVVLAAGDERGHADGVDARQDVLAVNDDGERGARGALAGEAVGMRGRTARRAPAARAAYAR